MLSLDVYVERKSRARKMEWTNEKALKLIDEYEKVPELWDAKHPLHFNRNKKLDAWEIIANNMKMDVAALKQKIGSLLGSFRREKAKGKKSIGTGKARKDIYISKWFAFERMHFLLDKDEPRTTMDTDNENNEEQESDEFPLNLNSQEDLSNSGDQEIDDEPSNDSTIEKMPFIAPETKQKKRKLHDKKDDAKLEEAFKILKESAARKEIPPDDCTIYSQHIANKLRNYSKNTRIQVEHSINNILFAADMGKYDYPNPTFNYENVPASNYRSTHFYDNEILTSSPLPSPTFSNASIAGSISSCPTPIPDFNIQNKNFEQL